MPYLKDNYLPRTAQMDAKPPNLRSSTPKMRLGTPKMRLCTPKMRLGTPKMRFGTPNLGLGTPNLHLRTASLHGETAYMGINRYFQVQQSLAAAGDCSKRLGYRFLERAFLYLYPLGWKIVSIHSSWSRNRVPANRLCRWCRHNHPMRFGSCRNRTGF